MKNFNNNRVLWVDYAKGIGIFLVVYGHVIVGINASTIELYGTFHYYSRNIIWNFHMALFFFLAGINVHSSLIKRGHLKFIADKGKIVLYPYIVWSIFTGTIQIVLSRYVNSTIAITDILKIWRALHNSAKSRFLLQRCKC